MVIRRSRTSDLAQRYRGKMAANYDEVRVEEAAWWREQAIVASMLEVFPRNAAVLDAPVGTGRFFEVYQARELQATGIDISSDMLTCAASKADQLGAQVTLEEGDIRNLRFAANGFDGTICIRLLNLIELPDAVRAVRELARVSKRYVILGVRYFLPTRELLQMPGGVRLAGRQLARRVRAAISPRVLRIHPQAPLLSAFAENGLRVIQAACVEQFDNGSNLVIHLLEKSGPLHA